MTIEPFPGSSPGSESKEGPSSTPRESGEMKLTSPIPSPREIVEQVLSQMSDFPEDEEKNAPSPDKPKPAKRNRLSGFFSS